MSSLMLSTVQRQRAAVDFRQCYEDWCRMQGTCPLPMVTAGLAEYVLACNGERLRSADWHPLCKALEINRSLRVVMFNFDVTKEDRGDKKVSSAAKKTAAGVSVSSARLDRSAIATLLCRSLGGMLRGSRVLQQLFLDGISLTSPDMASLSRGIAKGSQLITLSLVSCRIGDAGLSVVCKALATVQSFRHLDVSVCALTGKSSKTLAMLIERHATWRYSCLWQASLRHGRPDTDWLSGLRRLTLCGNPLLGDQAVSILTETLQDDIWIKAIDMQHCGLSNVGVQQWLQLLATNQTLKIVDLRQNPLADKQMIRRVLERLVLNGHRINEDPECLWSTKIYSPTQMDGGEQGPRSRPGRMGQARIHQTGRRGSRQRAKKRSLSAPCRLVSQERRKGHSALSQHSDRGIVVHPQPGMPWRTAARSALRRAGLASGSVMPLRWSAEAASTDSGSGSSTDCAGDGDGRTVVQRRTAHHKLQKRTTERIPLQIGDHPPRGLAARHQHKVADMPVKRSSAYLAQLPVERQPVDSLAKAETESVVRVNDARPADLVTVTSPVVQHRTVQNPQMSSGIDERILERFEQTLKKFSDFLELVKVCGYPTVQQVSSENNHQTLPQHTPDVLSSNSSF